jgi:hypothetical protein
MSTLERLLLGRQTEFEGKDVVEASCFVDWSGGTEEAKEQNYTDR